MRKWITNILHESRRYTVIAEASNGREAILKYNELHPDIVIMDLVMDDMDGIQTLRHLVYLFSGIKVIMCSSLAQYSSIQECLSLGAKDFIIKPNFSNLIQTLDNVAN